MICCSTGMLASSPSSSCRRAELTILRLCARPAPSLASKTRHLKRGVKEVVKSIRKGEKG